MTRNSATAPGVSDGALALCVVDELIAALTPLLGEKVVNEIMQRAIARASQAPPAPPNLTIVR